MAIVSIIVPVYNAEEYLEQCIRSLISQTLQDIEIICVNDGSTDRSQNILERFAECDSRVKVISKQNSGYGDSMNAGIAEAEGKYIGIVESDDFALPDMFFNLLQEAEKKGVDVVKANYYAFSQIGERQYREILSEMEYYEVFCPNDNAEIWAVTPSIWSGLYRKKFLKKQEILFHTSAGASYQDVSFWFKVLLSAEKMVCIPGAYLCYRCDNDNSSVKSPKKVFCIMDEFYEIKEYLKEKHKEAKFPIIIREQFIHYMGNYFRIDSIYQYAFLVRMREEFKQYNELNYIERRLWTEANWNLMQQIILDLDDYFELTNVDYLNKFAFKDYTINHVLSKIGAKKIVDDAEHIIIYGAGIYGHKLINMFSDKSKIVGVAVTELKDQIVEHIQGIPVYSIEELKQYHANSVVLVAIKKSAQQPILNILKKYGFDSVISVDEL